MLIVVFTAAMFASAALVFVVQPMAGKALLPHAGGTPAVWNTCLVFFQAVLLLGYLYADRLTRLPVRGQVIGHLAAAAAGVAALVTLDANPEWVPADSDYPVGGLVAYLAALVGVPFFVLSATAPLLQKWFAATGHRSAADPYFLYAASNAGSLVGLLGYPFLVEPNLSLDQQRVAWASGFAGVVGLIALIGVGLWLAETVISPQLKARERFRQSLIEDDLRTPSPNPSPAGTSPAARPNLARLLKWVALAALPSSLLMGATTHLTTDVAPVPLLWVVPLALYLVSFVVVFAWWPPAVRARAGRAAPMLLVFLVVALLTGATEPIALVAGIHLAAFFAVALLCHGELAHDRPPREHLTMFYLALSAGGVLGGLFNALVAPVAFAHFGLVEYPLAVVLAGLVRPDTPVRPRKWDALYLTAFVGLAVALALAVPPLIPLPPDDSPDALPVRLLRSGLMFGVPAVVAFALVRGPVRFAACLAVMFLAGALVPSPHGETLLVTRNFFGTLRVTRTPDGTFTRLVHGTTQHGQQRAGSPEPLMYYHRTGPVGRLLTRLPPERRRRVAAVGLGCGAMAYYAQPGEEWTFYEIDPGVVRVARDHFTYLRDAKTNVRVVLGDARRQLEREPDGAFDLIVLDAFSSDAIPVHLLTEEAFAVYARKLAPHGVLALHLSNRYLDLPPMAARLGARLEPPFLAKLDNDSPTDREKEEGKWRSDWVVLYRDAADLGPVAKDVRWQPLPARPGPVWSDGFSNLLAVWKRDEE